MSGEDGRRLGELGELGDGEVDPERERVSEPITALEGRRPMILPRTLYRDEVSDRADRAGEGGERSGSSISGIEGRQ